MLVCRPDGRPFDCCWAAWPKKAIVNEALACGSGLLKRTLSRSLPLSQSLPLAKKRFNLAGLKTRAEQRFIPHSDFYIASDVQAHTVTTITVHTSVSALAANATQSVVRLAVYVCGGRGTEPCV